MSARLTFISTLIGVALPALATAQTLTAVRAGEHGRYSRLVIPHAAAGWSITTKGRAIQITIPAAKTRFDLSEIVEKRKAHRVLSAQTKYIDDSAVISISLTCDCSVRAAQSAENSIVIDIYDELLSDIFAAAPTAANAHEPLSQPPKTPISSEESISRARARMMGILATASSQGVIQLKNANVTAPSPAPTPANDELDAPDSAASPPALLTPDAHPASDVEQETANAAPALTCVTSNIFSAANETQIDDAFAHVTALRERLEQAPANETEPAQIALAISYLQIGFFEEASAIAAPRSGELNPEMNLIASLAEIGGARKIGADKFFAQTAHCGPAYELLAATSEKDFGQSLVVDETHLAALKIIMASLRGLVAEKLALRAIDHEQFSLAQKLYNIAVEARSGERVPAHVLIETALNRSNGDDVATQADLNAIAQMPNPLQKRALGVLAENYARDAADAYDGLLDDLAEAASEPGGSPGDARAAFASAKALAANGLIREAVNILTNTAMAAPASHEAGRSLARSVLANALVGDDKNQRLVAIDTYIQHSDFLNTEGQDHALDLAVASELAEIGATALTNRVVRDLPDNLRQQSEAIAALARLNAGDDDAAWSIAGAHLGNPEFAAIALRAGERQADPASLLAEIRTGVVRGVANPDWAAAAWRAGDWKLAADAYRLANLQDNDAAAGAKFALTALMAGNQSMPRGAARALNTTPDDNDALAHMFKKAPQFNLRYLLSVADYADGVSKEITYVKRRLTHE